MTMYAGDELYDDDVTSGPAPDVMFENIFGPEDWIDRREDRDW